MGGIVTWTLLFADSLAAWLSASRSSAFELEILVTVEEAYTQCSKALIRSDLWNPERHIERSELPSSGAIIRSLTRPDFDAESYDRERAAIREFEGGQDRASAERDAFDDVQRELEPSHR